MVVVLIQAMPIELGLQYTFKILQTSGDVLLVKEAIRMKSYAEEIVREKLTILILKYARNCGQDYAGN